MEERLQKVLSRAGVASRRTAETLIVAGRVTVDGQTVRELGSKADPSTDDIRVDGRRIRTDTRRRYVLLYKPRGVVTTLSDPERRRTVMDLIGGVKEYVYPVGRLDYETEGLLLLTNDGDLAAMLTHPRHGVERTYEAHVAGMPDADALARLRRGIPLDGRRTLPARAEVLNPGRRAPKAVVRLVITEGRNRQVRRMLEAVGHPVDSLVRTRIGPISDHALKPGQWRDLTPAEVASLQRHASRPAVPRPAGAAGTSRADGARRTAPGRPAGRSATRASRPSAPRPRKPGARRPGPPRRSR
ncbi:MAG: pseudouridine synthase [Vicinamibacterales bacterium]